MKLVQIEGLSLGDLALSGQETDEATFTFPAAEGEIARTVKVRVDSGNLRFFPERSAGHREVLMHLGIST